MMGYKRNQSCRELFHKLAILSLPSQYILSLLIFLNKNKNQFTVNSEVHNYITRQHTNFHLHSVSLTKCQKRIGYLGVMVFNKLPKYLKEDLTIQKNLNKV